MEVNNTRKLYDALKSDGYTDLGDFSSFEGKLKDSGKREMLYDVLKKDGWQDLGDFSQFESKLGYAPINNENIKETDYVSQSSVNPPPISLRQEVDIPKSDQSEYVNPWTNSPDYNFESLRKKGKIETATPPPPTEYEKDSSFMNTWVGDAIQKLNAGGADLGAGIFGVLDKAAKGLESATGGLIPRGGAFKDISDIFKADAEFSRARSNRYNGKDFTDLWKEGNYMGAIGDIALQGVESLPMSIGAMAATMAGAPAAGLAGIGSIVASQKYDDLDQNNPNMGEFAKVSNAILTGTAESLSEMLGAGVSKAWMSTLFKTLGKEKAQEAIKRGIMGKMQEFYKKFGMFFEPVNEGIEEVSSTLAENITDKITGADPERDLTDGVLQSFVYGMGGGAYFTGAGALAKGAQYVADKIGGKQAQQPITDSNVTDQGVETPPLLTKSRFAEAEEQGRNMTDPGDIRTASKKMEETRLSLSEMVPGLASTIESYVDDKASEAQVMSLLDGVNADARPLAEEFYADYLRISGLQDRIGDEIDNDVETYVANNITPYVTTNPDGQSIVTTATLSEGNVERPVYVRSIEGDKAVISDNGQDRMVSVKRLSDIVEQDVGHMRRTYEDQLLATRQSELDMTMNHNPKTQLPKPGLVIWNGDNAFILQEQDENGDWIAQPAALDKETGQVAPKAGSAPAMPITERDILALQDAMYDAQQADVSVSDQIEGDDMIDKAIENEILQSEGQSNMSENDSQKPVKSSEPKYPLTKDGKPDYKKMTAAQRFVYTSETVSPEEALSDLDADIRSAEEALNKIKGKISKATGAERMSLRDQIKAKESEIEEMRELLPNKDTEGQKMESLLKEEIKESDSLSEDDQENVIENIPQEKDEAVQSKGGETSILTREDGTPDFVSSGTDMTLDFLYDKYGDKMPRKIEVTRKSFDESLKKASDALEKAQEAYDDAPIGKEDKAEAALIKARQEYEAIKVEADFWANLDDDIKEASKKPGDVIAKEISVMGDPMSGEELAAMMLANGAIKLTRDSYKKETGAGNNETARMFGLFASPEKGGVNIERAGEILELADRENGTNFFDENDTNAGRDAIIEVLSSAHTRGDLIDYVKRNREAIAERERQAEYNAYAEWCEENYHMSPEEYEAYEDDLRKQAEIVTEETIEYVNGEIADEIQAIIDEQNEIDAILAQNNESNEEIERNDEGGTGGLLEGGDQLLQGEQPIQAGRTGETEQGFTGIDDRVDRTDGATQEGAPEEVDRQGNPIDSEGNLIIEDVSSVSDITDEDFINPKRSIGLPPIPQNVSEAIASDGKKVIIKRNIFEKNAKKHAFDPQSSRDILEAALYNTDIVGQSQPLTRKKHWVAIKLDDKSPIVVLEVNHNKDNVEIVGWYTLDNRNLDRIKRQAEREGGELLILTPKGAAASLSTLPDNSSSTDKGSISSSENQANEAKSFVAPSPNENENPLDYAERIVEAKRLFDEELKVNTNPSEAQKEAGNYKKGHIKINGFDVTIEQPAGSVRSGKDASGKEWSQVMNNTYGYIRGTESVDGDHIDVFLGPDMNSDMVYVVDQVNTDGSFDEHKVMMGFSSLEDARSAYLSNYEEGWQGLGNITGVALDEFKKWIDSSIRKTKPFYEYRSVDFIEEERPDSGIRFRETRISPEEENIIEKAKSDGSYMKAPNGNPTNLNEKQWVQVRTKAFKEWFGDWENNPEDASKVIDENGEPRVVYHGTYADFNAFDESHLGDVTDLNATNEDWAKTSHIGFWFNDNKIGFYTKHKPVFLNVRNPLEFASMESLVDEMSYYDSGEDFKRSNSDGYDSVIVLEDEEMGGRSYVVFNDNQIKSVTENNEDFSFHNDETSKNEAVKQASDIDGAHFRSIGDKDTDNLNNAETIESSINDWSNKLNTPVRVIHDVDDITDTDENMLARKRDSKGWYDTSTGEIVIVSPNSTSVGDAQRTFLHEVVGHHGLRELFGDDFDTFLDNVYRNANEDIRENIIDRTKGNPLNLREATEEYIAELAERGFDNKAERSLWEKIKDSFLDMLRKAGISLDFKLSDNDLRYILWRSYKNLEQGNLMDVAEDIVMRNRLSLNNINLNENGSIARDIEPEKGKQPSETKGTGRELETIDGVDENGNESERDHIDKPRGVENAIDGTENATDRNGKKTDGQVDNDGDQLDGGDTGDRNGSVRDGIDGERTVIGRAGSENKGRGVGESVREKTDDFSFAERIKKENDNIRLREAKSEVEDEEPLNKEMVDAWDKVASSDSFKFKEAMVDSLTAIDEFLKLLAKKTKSKILDYENPYYSLIALSSKNKVDMDSFDSKFLNPLNEAIRALIGDASEVSKKGLRRTWDWSKGALRDLVKYVQAKHGIERNRDMSVRDGIETLKAFDVDALSKMGVISESDLKNAKKTAENVAEEKGSEAYKKTYDKVLAKELKKGVDKEKAERSAEIAADYRKSLVKSEIYNKEMDKYKEKVTGTLIDRWEDSKKDILNKDLAWDEEQKELDQEALSFQWKLGDNSYGVILGKDYSGLSSVFKPSEDGANKDKWLSDAYDFVRDYESTHNMVLVDNLWDKVHNVSEYTLRRQYESGLISKSYMDKNLSRFKYFIPLRGFSDNIASDVYDYIDATEIKMGNPVKTAKGRISEADNPFAGLIHVGYGSITAGNRNLAKQRFLNLASNHDTGGLITIDNIWVRNVGTEENPEWVESIPQIPDNASGEEVAKAVKDHEEMMRELREEGKAELIKGGRSDIPYKTLYDQRSQHQVQVFVGGNRYVMTVNGNPRLAQAVNGLTNPDVKDDLAYVVARNLKTFMAGAFTSKNVAFSFANLIRDTPYANNSVFVTENFRYFKDFSGNQRRALFGLRSLGRNLYKYRRGEIDISDKEQAIFKEFMDNGGATGYTFVETQKEYAKDLANKLEKLSDGNIGKLSPKELVSTVFECFEFMGNVAELVNRYAAYKTSREHGRSIDRSINDAKEVSVNFNKKGAGKKTKSDKWYINTAAWISEYGRDWVLFFNAAVQSMYKEYSMMRNHPIKGIGSRIAPLIFMGSSVSLLNNLFMPMLFAYLGWDSDDDDRDYFDSLSDHERQNNICIRLTHGRWLKIPLSPELANYFKIGDIIAGQLSGKREVEAMDVVKTGIDMVSPLNINWEYDSWKFALNLLPTVVQPIAQNASNVNFMGNPIYKTSMNKANDYDPEYTKVYRSTSTTMVELSRALNSLTGGDDVKRGTSFNPATWQNILSGYTGGFGTVALGVSDLVLDMLSGENGDMPVSRYPLLSRFLTGGDKDLKLSRMNSIYNKKVVDFVSEMDHDYKGYLKKIQDTSVDDFDRAGYMVKLNQLTGSDDYRRSMVLSQYVKAISDMERFLREVGSDNDSLENQVYELKLQALEIFEDSDE